METSRSILYLTEIAFTDLAPEQVEIFCEAVPKAAEVITVY
jgi:hypothetical protein